MPAFLIPFLDIIMGIALSLGIISLIFSSDKGRAAFSKALSNLVGGAFDVILPVLSGLEGGLAPMVKGFVDALNAHSKELSDIVKQPAADLASKAFSDIESKLTSAVSYLPEDSPIMAANAMGEAFGFGMASHAVSMAFESVLPEKLNTLNAAGPILEKMAGFDEVAAAVREPLYENAFGKGLDYHYKSIFKPEFASEGEAVEWHSRRLLSPEDLLEVFKYSGLKAKYEDAFTQSAYRAIQPRALVSLVQDVVFPTDNMKELLKFAGIRDVDIARLLPLMEDNSTKNLRNEYVAAVTRAAEMGTIDDPTLDGHLDSLNFSDQAKNYVHLTVAVKRLEQLAELYRKSVTALYETNQLDDTQYVPALQAIGINDADANAHFAIDSARKHGRELLKEERDLARVQGRQTALAVQTARSEYFQGTLDDAAFAAAITASGLPADLIPGTIALGVAQKSARRVEKYGLLLDRTQAQVLTEKVAALKEQVVKKLTPIDAASQTLDSFGIPPANRNALLSDWSAQALKTVLPV
jgi:hypothetical protein